MRILAIRSLEVVAASVAFAHAIHSARELLGREPEAVRLPRDGRREATWKLGFVIRSVLAAVILFPAPRGRLRTADCRQAAGWPLCSACSP